MKSVLERMIFSMYLFIFDGHSPFFVGLYVEKKICLQNQRFFYFGSFAESKDGSSSTTIHTNYVLLQCVLVSFSLF